MTQEEMQKQIESMMPTPNQIVESIDKNLKKKRERIVHNILSQYAKKKELKLLISNGGDFESNNSKQKPTWSEEDEKMYRMCVDAVEYYHTSEDESVIRDWLISLKERLS